MISLVGLRGRLSSEVSQLEAEVSMIIGQQILNWLPDQTKASPRRRRDLNLRYSPTDHKSSTEDVSDLRGQGIGRMLMEHFIELARREMAFVFLNLISRLERIAANEMYRW